MRRRGAGLGIIDINFAISFVASRKTGRNDLPLCSTSCASSMQRYDMRPCRAKRSQIRTHAGSVKVPGPTKGHDASVFQFVNSCGLESPHQHDPVVAFVFVDMIRLDSMLFKVGLLYLISSKSNKRNQDESDATAKYSERLRDEGFAIGRTTAYGDARVIVECAMVDGLELEGTGCRNIEGL